ncbi:hypothetical protein PRIPAC_88408, partial [Pristionchus pacificus]|uniref:Uncharacterized protein n=1 Tax=Pristionchus pacificus TaxID=54126 RepID=A0A2A6B8L3_PRIPA
DHISENDITSCKNNARGNYKRPFARESDKRFSRVLMTMGILIFHIDVPLAPDGVTSKTGSERAWGIERAQREGRGQGRETRVDQEIGSQQGEAVISIEFYLGSQTRLIFAFILTEEFWKNCFRRHAVWSQRNVDMKNEYPHRHQHPREP